LVSIAHEPELGELLLGWTQEVIQIEEFFDGIVLGNVVFIFPAADQRQLFVNWLRVDPLHLAKLVVSVLDLGHMVQLGRQCRLAAVKGLARLAIHQPKPKEKWCYNILW
jgi:hypothetical protein